MLTRLLDATARLVLWLLRDRQAERLAAWQEERHGWDVRA